MKNEIDIATIPKEDLLVELYNGAAPVGLGNLQSRPGSISKQEAKELLRECSYFDYLHGRVLKVDFEDYPKMRTDLYDRDNGEGAFARAVERAAAAGRAAQQIISRTKISRMTQRNG